MLHAFKSKIKKGEVSERTLEIIMPSHYGKGKKKGKKKKGGMKKKKGLTAKQKKLPLALQRAILKKQRGK